MLFVAAVEHSLKHVNCMIVALQVFSDDGEGDDEDGPPAAKKAHLSADAFYGDDPADDGEARVAHGDSSGRLKGMEGTVKKSIIKNSVTPWNRAGMGGSSSGAGGKTPHYSSADKQPKGGLNRAARRAMGGGGEATKN